MKGGTYGKEGQEAVKESPARASVANLAVVAFIPRHSAALSEIPRFRSPVGWNPLPGCVRSVRGAFMGRVWAELRPFAGSRLGCLRLRAGDGEVALQIVGERGPDGFRRHAFQAA